MGKYNLQRETYILEADSSIEYFNCDKYVDWAVKALENGYESDNLFIVAGLYDERPEVVYKYFEQAKVDFQLDTYNTLQIKFHEYAKYIMEDVINKSIKAEKGLYLLEKIYKYLDFDPKYLVFVNLADDLSSFEEEDSFTRYNTITSLKSYDEYVIEECRLFLLYEDFENKEELEKLFYCGSCDYIGLPHFRMNTFFSRNADKPCCSKCKSKDIYPFSNQVGRKKIIESVL